MSDAPATKSLIDDQEARIPLIVYALYLAGFVSGVTLIIGIVVAYVNKNDGPEWIQTHYRFQIRTFWGGLALLIPTFILMVPLFFIAKLLPMLVVIWFIVRCVFGIKYLSRREPHPNPTTWKW